MSEKSDPLSILLSIVSEQAEDGGVWFVAATAPEAYLQHELRRLHVAAEALRTVGECLTLGGHDGSPCSFCGHKSRPRPPAIPNAALVRERSRHPDRSSHFGSSDLPDKEPQPHE